ncbi:MAG: methyltransferase domain-containing protein [Dokdonella sp.]
MKLSRLKSLLNRGADASAEQLVTELYRGLLGREPDPGGLRSHVDAMNAGAPLGEIARGMTESEEFSKKQGYLRVLPAQLPDLVALHPQRYRLNDDGSSTFSVRDDADFDWLERMIHEHRYYDSFGVWSPVVDIDKRVIAALVTGLGAKRCLELGCFTGPVLSLLDAQGIDVAGVEISHLAFVLAYPSIKNRIHYGDLLSVELQAPFDAVIAMDILEHLNPLKLDLYLARIAGLLDRNGYFLINSPMFGADDVFGEVAPPFLPEWRAVGPQSFWRHLHCDAQGWPMHGHLVWASPSWWEGLLAAHGLVRDRALERRVQADLGTFFERYAPARKSFFLLRHANATSSATADRVSAALMQALATEPALARPA